MQGIAIDPRSLLNHYVRVTFPSLSPSGLQSFRHTVLVVHVVIPIAMPPN